ncbi:MAG TPA: RDD family protein [Euzebyales bacterium]
MRTRKARWTLFAIAGVSDRAVAFVIDAAIFWVVWMGGVIWLVESGELGTAPRPWAPRALVWAVVVLVGWLAYDALSIAAWGGTAGRRVMGIEVRDVGGGLPGRRAAAIRSCVRAAVAVALAVRPSLLAGPERRGPHDRVAGTVVVSSAELEPAGDDPGGRSDAAAPADATETAIRAGAPDAAMAGWLRAIAQQTGSRLDVAAPSWRRSDDPDDIRDRAFCLLLAALAPRHPDHRDVLVAVIDAHAALDDLGQGRLRHLTALVADHGRARDWLRLPESARLAVLLDTTTRLRAGVGQATDPHRR